METYNYHRTDLKHITVEYLDSKKETKLYKIYNRNTDLSSIIVSKKFNDKGLYIFYCNNLSNLDEIELNKKKYRGYLTV